MSYSDRSPDVVEKGMACLRNASVPEGPSSQLMASTAARLSSLETSISLRAKRKELMFRIVRYGSVAAAVTALLGTVVWILVVDRSASLVFAEVKNRVDRVQSVQYLETRETGGKQDEPRRHTILGRYLTRTEVLRNDGTIECIDIQDAGNGMFVSIYPMRKEFVVIGSQVSIDMDGGNKTDEKLTSRPEVDFYRRMRDVPDEPNKRLPEKTLGSRKVVGFYFEERQGAATWKKTYWVDPKTKLPVRVEKSVSSRDPSVVPSHWVLSDFIFDQDLDASLFSTEPPEGYTVKTEKIMGIRMP